MRFSARIAAMLALLLAFGAPVAATVEADAGLVSPVTKVIELLNNMLSKGKEEKHEEQVQYAAYKQFCDDTTTNKKRAIEEADEKIEMLKAEIAKTESDAELLSEEIKGHDADLATWSGDEKAATKVRQIEKADYQALHSDYTESIDALERAITYLKKKAQDTPQASSFAEVKALKGAKLIPEDARKAIDTFLQSGDVQGLSEDQPDANAYEFQSHGIIDMLEKLLDKFTDERTALEKKEMNQQHAYEMLQQDLRAQIDQAKIDRGAKVETKAKKLQATADAKGDLTDASSTRKEDHQYLSDMKSTCKTKAGDFEQRQQLRTEEIEAIEKAIEILQDGIKSGSAAALAQQSKKGHALAQLRSNGRSPTQEKASEYLRIQAANLNSRVLAALSTHVMDDPFTKVKKLIKDLIVRLMQEANEEAEHKGWCDTELSTNAQTRKEKSAAVETLTAEIDELESSIAQLQEDVEKLTKEVSELASAMAEATKLRQAEKAENEVTIKDAADAQQAVAQAMVVLKEFYAKSAESTALVQRKKQPEIFDSPYKGMQAENGGVVAMLEVVESDFARLETETSAAEATSQKQYDDTMTESKVSKATKEKDIEHKGHKKQDQEQALISKKADLEGTQKELDAAMEYYEKLKPSCVDAGVSYEERVSRRKEEIQSLQEALRILNGEEVA